VEAATFFRQDDLSRSSVEQSHTDTRFETRHSPADPGRGQAKHLCCPREIPGFRHGGEDTYAGQ
jgi:hypothetical protein